MDKWWNNYPGVRFMVVGRKFRGIQYKLRIECNKMPFHEIITRGIYARELRGDKALLLFKSL